MSTRRPVASVCVGPVSETETSPHEMLALAFETITQEDSNLNSDLDSWDLVYPDGRKIETLPDGSPFSLAGYKEFKD